MKFNLDSLKGLVDQVKAKGTEYTGAAADKAKDAAQRAKLMLELNAEKDALKKAYLELGKACYEEKAVAAEGVLGQLFGEVDAVKARIDALQQEIDARGARDEAGDFEATVAESEPDVEVEITQEPEEPKTEE